MDSQEMVPQPRARWKVVTITIVAVVVMALIAGFVVVRVLQNDVHNQFNKIGNEIENGK